MTKQNKKSKAVETVEHTADEVVEATMEVEQAEERVADFAENSQETTASNAQETVVEPMVQAPKTDKKEQKGSSGGTALALLALLVALGVGGAGYYFGSTKFNALESRVQALTHQLGQEKQVAPSKTVEIPSFEAEKAQLARLSDDYQKAQERVRQLEEGQNGAIQQINALQAQIQKLGVRPSVESSTWLFSEADFLLNNALRKVVLDNDIETAKSLLIEADNVLSQAGESGVLSIREAIKNDLAQLAGVNQVDQQNLMHRLATLANLLDDMPLAISESSAGESNEVSDSLADWQKNIEKSADSFLSHFIRISDKANIVNDKAFIAPNQEIYLRENIRLRLQIAMMSIPRQQNDLYKQSVEAVGSWVRSYFDVENVNVKRFLKEIDDLSEQSIYIDAPTRLQSLDLLSQQLNRVLKPVTKIRLDEEKSLEQLKVDEKAVEAETNNQPSKPATE